jgi:hypothetical protein
VEAVGIEPYAPRYANPTRALGSSAYRWIIPGGSTIGSDVPSFVPTKLFEGKLPSAHPAANEIPTEKN